LPYLERDFVGRCFGLFDAQYGLAEELLRMRLLVQHLVWRHRGQNALQPGGVWSVQEELLPEALG
jgi:hypothetical protein